MKISRGNFPNLSTVSTALLALFYLAAGGFVSAKAAGGSSASGIALEVEGDGSQEPCLYFGSHTEEMPKQNPFNRGCPKPSAGPDDDLDKNAANNPENPLNYNPYSGANQDGLTDEYKARQALVSKIESKGRQVPINEASTPETSQTYLFRPGGAETPQAVGPDRPWGDFIYLSKSEESEGPMAGVTLTLVSVRAFRDSQGTHIVNFTFKPNNVGHLDWAGPTDGPIAGQLSFDPSNGMKNYVYYYHQFLRSWLEP